MGSRKNTDPNDWTPGEEMDLSGAAMLDRFLAYVHLHGVPPPEQFEGYVNGFLASVGLNSIDDKKKVRPFHKELSRFMVRVKDLPPIKKHAHIYEDFKTVYRSDSEQKSLKDTMINMRDQLSQCHNIIGNSIISCNQLKAVFKSGCSLEFDGEEQDSTADFTTDWKIGSFSDSDGSYYEDAQMEESASQDEPLVHTGELSIEIANVEAAIGLEVACDFVNTAGSSEDSHTATHQK